jgi:dihydrofolate reductase
VNRLILSTTMTVDGVVSPAEWYVSEGEHDRAAREQFEHAAAMLLGRKTYEGFAEAWPSREGDFADKFNSMPKYVVSSTLKDPEWTNSTVIDGDVGEEVSRLRQEHDGDIVVHGSAQLVEALIENDLVDELRLMVFPVVLGTGKRVFGATSDKKPLRLVDSKVVGDGVAVLIYEPADEEAKGSDSD